MSVADGKYTAREVEIMAAVLQSLKDGLPTQSQINIPKLAAKVGMTEGSATVTWGRIKKKLTDDDHDGAAPETPGADETKAKKTPVKRKITTGKKGDENGENGNTETPTKKARGRKPKAKATTPVEEGTDDIETEEIETPAKTPVKKKAVPKIKASPKSPLVSSDETAHEDGDTITVETAKAMMEVVSNNEEVADEASAS